MTPQDLLASLPSPPASHRPQPLWVWNGVVTRKFISRSLTDLKAAGMGGVFVHPRPGLITEYLSEEWFELFNFACAEAARLGMECHIYDENSFPAGFAGGHVPAANPNTVSCTLRGTVFHAPTDRPQLPGEALACFHVGPDKSLAPAPLDAYAKASADAPVLVVCLVRPVGDAWYGGFPGTDLLLPATSREFLRVTHDRYAEAASRFFGSTCRYAFSDEPLLHRGDHELPFSRHFQAEFKREHKYDLIDRLGDFLSGTGAGKGVRCDYWLTVSRLFEHNFARTVADWCAEHGLAFTGHYMEHEWPSPGSHPSAMALMRYMQVPGNDLLGFQFSVDKPPEHNHPWWMNLVELRSVANQTGAERTLCETTGGGGYAYTIRDFKSCEDFALAGGVNLVNPHLVHQTLTGARRYDWGHTISPHSPWFDAYRVQADHVARVQHALLAGRFSSRVLLLHPTTTGWLEFLPKSLGLVGDCGYAARETLRRKHSALVRRFSRYAVDFDLGDELILRDLGGLDGARLTIGKAAYDVVVIPDTMENVLAPTLGRLAAFVKAGGKVLSLRKEPPKYVNGRLNAQPWPFDVEVVDESRLFARLRELVPPHVSFENGPAPETVFHLRREIDAGSAVHFFANPFPADVTLSVTIEGTALAAIDTATGAVSALTTEGVVGGQRVMLRLPGRGHALLLTSVASVTSAVPRASSAPEVAAKWSLLDPGAPANIARAEENLLVLNYCDVRSAGGASADSVAAINADQLVWRDHGFDRNPWKWAVQYRRTCLELDFPDPSGFEVAFHFEVRDADVIPSLRVAFERPHLYDAKLNDVALPLATGEPFFDEEMLAFPAAHAARVGRNTLRLRARKMHALCEITPPCVLGDFSLIPAERGFDIAAPAPLSLGPLIPQGLPHYNRGVVFTYALTLLAPASRLRVELPAWAGSVVGVRVGVRSVGWITTSPGVLEFATSLPCGTHALSLDLRGHLQNQLGPFFDDGLPIPGAWEASPSPQPAGKDYSQLKDWGLLEAPRISAC